MRNTKVSRALRAVKLRRWGDGEIALVLKIRRENPTYGKFKIYHILKRDYGFQMSESTVGRILKYLMDKGKIMKFISAVKAKRKRKFDSRAKPAPFKKQAWERRSKTIVILL